MLFIARKRNTGYTHRKDENISNYVGKKKDITVKLNPGNFDKEVMRSKDIWFIMFTTVDCKHCKKVKGKFKLAASKMNGLVKFGEVDLSVNENG